MSKVSMISREMVVSTLIADAFDRATVETVAMIDGITIERYSADPALTWWDVYITDLAGDIATAELAKVQQQLGRPLGECLVKERYSARTAPQFPESSSVTLYRYCGIFTEEVEEA
ncbi:hypothetical protein [Streptomyces decoyicus]